MYTLEYLIREAPLTEAEFNGQWVPARPIPLYGIAGLWARLKDAWEVLTGRADAFIWPKGQ